MEYKVTLFFYLLIGAGVAVALWLGEPLTSNSHVVFRSLTAPLFWPIYVPVLLSRPTYSPTSRSGSSSANTMHRNTDEMGSLITQVERELEAALRSLNGWAGDLFEGEQNRIAELRTAWRQQADRVRELDQLLAQTSDGPTSGKPSAVMTREPAAADEQISSSHSAQENEEPTTAEDEAQSRIATFERARHENLEKLKLVRRQMADDLMATLAWVRELVTMIHLAKYTGAPASRAVELVQQIAAAVHGLSNREHAG